MEGLTQVKKEIAQKAETLKKAFERWRGERMRRPTQGRGGPEPRWKNVLLRFLIGLNCVLLISLVTFTIKPLWLSQLKGRFLSPPTTPVAHNPPPATPRRTPPPKRAIPRKSQIVKHTTPPTQKSETLPKEMTTPHPVIPKRVERPQAVTPSPLPATRQDQELEEHLEIGALYAQKGKYDKAEELFQKVTKQNPSSAKAHNNLGFVYLNQGKYELAERELKEALRLDPASVLPYYNLACLYCRKGMEVEALIYLKRALKRDARVKLWAMTDEDFDGLRSDVVFQGLLGISSPEGKGVPEVTR
jgi:TolA-binding protein